MFMNPHQPGRSERWQPERENCPQGVAPLDSMFSEGGESVSAKGIFINE